MDAPGNDAFLPFEQCEHKYVIGGKVPIIKPVAVVLTSSGSKYGCFSNGGIIGKAPPLFKIDCMES